MRFPFSHSAPLFTNLRFNLFSAYANYIDDRLVNCTPLSSVIFIIANLRFILNIGQTLYYGANYPKLKQLKAQYDPVGTLNFPTAIQ